MKIQKLYMPHLRNDAHFQFHTEVIKFISKTGAERLKIKPLFDSYQLLYNQLDEAYKKINKSAITKHIQDADRARDETWSGFVEIVSGSTKHFNAALKEAARKLMIVIDTYGNIARKPLNEQTSATYNILQEFEGKYAPEVAIVGVGEWVGELKTRNQAFDDLMTDRYDESATKNHTVLRDARLAIDEIYKAIVSAINSFVMMYGTADYEVFVNTLNEVIAKFKKAKRGSYGLSGSSGSSEPDDLEDELDDDELSDSGDDTTESTP